MGDAESVLHPSKKRNAGQEISRDNPGLDDDEENLDQEIGTFKKASEEVLRLAPSSNLLGATSVVTGQAKSCKSDVTIDAIKETDDENTAADGKKLESEAGETKAEATAVEIKHGVENKADDTHLESGADESKGEAVADTTKHDGGTGPFQPCPIDVKDAEVSSKAEDETEKDLGPDNIEKEAWKNTVVPVTENENNEKSGEATPLGSFRLLSSSQNAFTGVAGPGFSGSSFSFGVTSKDGSFVCGSAFGFKTGQSSFGFGSSNNRNSPIFGTPGTSITAIARGGEGSGFPVPQEVCLETGKENEKPVFVADSVLFEYLDGAWIERGKGEVKVNVSTTGAGKARLIMRTRGNYRLILNASLFPDMKLTNMEKKGITFACVNSVSEGTGGGLSTFALKFKDIHLVDEFRSCVMEHKGSVAAAALKNPRKHSQGI